ncbi:MAG: phage holin family protein [Bacteroidales bacterium]
MENHSLKENISELNSIIKSYIEARIDLWKVLLLEKVTKIGTYFFTVIAVLITFLFTLLFLTFAFSFWFGNAYGNITTGFLISAGFFLILALVIYWLRKPLFSNNIIKNIGSIIFSDHEDEKK